MNVPKLTLYLFPLITFISLATEALASCPSMQQGPPCQEFWRADAVFIGVANRVVHTPAPTGYSPYVRTTVYFTIDEAFRGVGGTGIVIDISDCGHPFKENERYLVYARRNPNNNELQVRVGNTRTRPLSEAVEDLEYIRGLSSAEPGSMVFGRVAQYTHNIKESRYVAESLENIKVILDGKDESQEAVTDSEGRYEFKGLSKGTYRIRAQLPAYLNDDDRTVELTDRGCFPIDISPTRKGEIAGRVLDMNGKPLVSVPVSLVPADASREQIFSEAKDKGVWTFSMTNNEGRYSFSHLAPGSYLLIINRTEFERSRGTEISYALPRLFHPGVNDVAGATVIVVGKDHEPQEYNFHLPIVTKTNIEM